LRPVAEGRAGPSLLLQVQKSLRNVPFKQTKMTAVVMYRMYDKIASN
jgi:hypothetical protein